MKKDREEIVLNLKGNLDIAGFKRVPDRYRFLSKGCIVVFVTCFFGIIAYSFYKTVFYIPNLEIFTLILMLLSIVLGNLSVCLPRYCPLCSGKMRFIKPDENDHTTSFKHYCGFCKLYMDTETYNSSGD